MGVGVGDGVVGGVDLGQSRGRESKKVLKCLSYKLNINVADVWRKLGCTTECYVLSFLLLVIREEPCGEFCFTH